MVLALCVIVCAGLVLLAIRLAFQHYLPLFLHARGIPKGSFGWPLLGETLTFLRPHASNSIGLFLIDHCSRYGKVFKSHLFCSPTIVSCDQELNYFILQNEERLFQCSYPKPIHGILGKFSMLVVLGESHKKLRNLALMLVNTTKSSPDYLIDLEKTTLQIMSSWKDSNHQVVFSEEARKFSFNVIVKQILGLTPDDPNTSSILNNFLTFMRGLVSFPLYIPGLPYAKAVQARARIFSTVKALMKERNSCSKKGDFLDMLLSVHNLSDDEKVSFVLDALLGGYETTSLLMAMAVHFLGQSQLALEELKWEHCQIRMSKRKDDYLNWEDYKKMEFTQHVINESLRCGNIVKFVHRKALKDVRYKDYLIPSGWKVLPIFSAVHLDSSLHETSFGFDPWRWENQQNQAAACKKFTPFGGGLRCCPGSELAKVETAFFLHHLVLNFRWSTLGMDPPLAYPFVEFRNGMPLTLVPMKRSTHLCDKGL